MAAAPKPAMDTPWSVSAISPRVQGRSSRCSVGDPPQDVNSSSSSLRTEAASLSRTAETVRSASAGATGRRRFLERCSIFDVKAMEDLFNLNGVKMMHLYTLWRHVVQKQVTDLESIPGLPKIVPVLVERHCMFPSSKVVKRSESADGSTSKLLIELQDGKRIESVIMRYGQVELDTFPTSKRRPCGNGVREETETEDSVSITQDGDNASSASTFASGPRSTVCVSSQVGCAMGCTFCATGTMKLHGNLTSGEIIEQLYLASRLEPIRNIVFMGMGEPLDNYDEVVDAIRVMTDVRVFRLCSSRVSVSTVGVLPRLRQLKFDVPDISLAVSLHAPTQAIREKIVPSAKSWRIDDILAAAFDYAMSQKARTSRNMKRPGLVLLEYVLISDVNSSVECAEALGHLLQPHLELVHLNIIPYNPISGSSLSPPSQQELDTFVNTLRLQDIRVTIRQTLGQDVAGACGQLVVETQSKSMDGCSLASSNDVEDILTTVPTLAATHPVKLGLCDAARPLPRHNEFECSEAVPPEKPRGRQWWLAALVGTAILAVGWTSWTALARRLAAPRPMH